jgi:hypothetical protein
LDLLLLLMLHYLSVHLLDLLLCHSEHALLCVAPQLLPLGVARALLLGCLVLIVNVTQPLFKCLALGKTVDLRFERRLVLLLLILL